MVGAAPWVHANELYSFFFCMSRIREEIIGENEVYWRNKEIEKKEGKKGEKKKGFIFNRSFLRKKKKGPCRRDSR